MKEVIDDGLDDGDEGRNAGGGNNEVEEKEVLQRTQ